VDVLVAAGYQVHIASPEGSNRPLCCGRTYLSVGDVDKAREEAKRTMAAVMPYVNRGLPIVGLEPSCLLTMRDEFLSLLPGDEANQLADNAFLLDEFLENECAAGRARLDLEAMPGESVLLHGHCHQKAFNVLSATEKLLRRIPEVEIRTVQSTCCGMAGAFGYQAENYDTSMAIGEL